jgi:imidazolonepropionase-like amidohydrolase
MEMTRWADAGVPLPRILRAAIMENAEQFALWAGLGSIEVGKRANLLLLRGDPLKAINAFGSIETIFLDGNPIPRSSLLPVN